MTTIDMVLDLMQSRGLMADEGDAKAVFLFVLERIREPTKKQTEVAWSMISSNLRYEEVYSHLIDALRAEIASAA